MTYKQIEASREARLWIGQVIVPAVTCTAIALANKDVRTWLVDNKNKMVSKFKKK